MVTLLVGGLILWKVLANSKVDFKKVYSECSLEEPWATLGRDNSYLLIETNPNDIDEDDFHMSDITMFKLAMDAVQEVNEYLGLPEYLYEDMGYTTALQGKQSEKFEDIGIEVTWSYHPDNGLEVRYKLL